TVGTRCGNSPHIARVTVMGTGSVTSNCQPERPKCRARAPASWRVTSKHVPPRLLNSFVGWPTSSSATRVGNSCKAIDASGSTSYVEVVVALDTQNEYLGGTYSSVRWSTQASGGNKDSRFKR